MREGLVRGGILVSEEYPKRPSSGSNSMPRSIVIDIKPLVLDYHFIKMEGYTWLLLRRRFSM